VRAPNLDGACPAVSSASCHGGQFLSILRSGGGSFPRWWDLLSAPWGLVFLVGFRFAGGGYRFRSVCLGDSMAGRRGFGAALLLSLDGGGASFSFLWCSTGIVRHLPTSGAPHLSCSGGLSGARRLLGRRRLEFTVATAGGPWHFAAAKRDTAREPNSSRSPLVDTADGLTQRVHLAHQRPGPSGTVVFFPSTPLRSFHCSSSTKKHYKRKVRSFPYPFLPFSSRSLRSWLLLLPRRSFFRG